MNDYNKGNYERIDLDDREIQTLKRLHNFPSKKVIDISECAELLADVTYNGKDALNKHIEEYGEIQLSVLTRQLLTEPLIALFKYHPDREYFKEIYYKIIEIMSQNGTAQVREAVEEAVLKPLSEEKTIWKAQGWRFKKITTPRLVVIKRNLIKTALVVSTFFLICFWLKRNLPIGRTDFDSIEHFEEMGGECWRYGLPDGAQDVKYHLTYIVLSGHSLYSFRIDNEEKYDAFMEFVRDKAIYEYSADYPGWEWYKAGRENCSEVEYVEREYLKQNYLSMDYKEILERASEHKYGFANAYGADVEDYIDLDYSLDNFPIGLPYEEVIEDDIRDYTLLVYNPSGSGSVTEGIAVNEKTHQFVVFYCGTIK